MRKATFAELVSGSKRFIAIGVRDRSANAERDGRPAEYRWHPLFNAAKFGWCALLECRAVTKPRLETVEICLGAPNNGTDLSR